MYEKFSVLRRNIGRDSFLKELHKLHYVSILFKSLGLFVYLLHSFI